MTFKGLVSLLISFQFFAVPYAQAKQVEQQVQAIVEASTPDLAAALGRVLI